MTAVMSIKRCQELLQAAFPSLPLRRVRYLAQGWDSTVFEVNDQLIFRFPKRALVNESLCKEIRLLPELGSLLPVPVPQFAFVAHSVLDYPWHFVGYPKLSGTPLAVQDLTETTGESVAAILARCLQALHEFSTARAADLGVPTTCPSSWFAEHQRLYEQTHGTLQDHLKTADLQRFEALWAVVFSAATRHSFTPTLIHGDLGIEHILISDGSQVSGIIDFGDAKIADPALDFAGFPRQLARMVWVHFHAPLDDTFWERRELYVWAVPLHAIAAGIELQRSDLIEEGRVGLQRLLAEETHSPTT